MSVRNNDTTITISNKMKAALIEKHGTNMDDLIQMTSDRPVPKRNKGELLIKVKACALAPGDVRVLKGDCDYFQSPKPFPYIPGGDLSGIVVEADETSRFKKGNDAFAMFEIPRPFHGLAEYALVKESLAEIKPASISYVEASALTSSALAAYLAARSFVQSGNRVLVLGGSGGVGTFFVQFAKLSGASYIACTSTQQELLYSLGVDRVLDYTHENWWEQEEYVQQAFDIILDTVGGKEPWIQARRTRTLKRNGRFVVMNGDEPHMQIHNSWQTMQFMFRLVGRQLWTSMCPFVPNYIWHANALDLKPGNLQEMSRLVEQGKVQVVLDPMTPVPFEREPIRNAFKLMESRHAHGKVVVEIQ
jgi:NADPH:quinone reductase-like Zn-dependent oxidoreductase